MKARKLSSLTLPLGVKCEMAIWSTDQSETLPLYRFVESASFSASAKVYMYIFIYIYTVVVSFYVFIWGILQRNSKRAHAHTKSVWKCKAFNFDELVMIFVEPLFPPSLSLSWSVTAVTTPWRYPRVASLCDALKHWKEAKPLNDSSQLVILFWCILFLLLHSPANHRAAKTHQSTCLLTRIKVSETHGKVSVPCSKLLRLLQRQWRQLRTAVTSPCRTLRGALQRCRVPPLRRINCGGRRAVHGGDTLADAGVKLMWW